MQCRGKIKWQKEISARKVAPLCSNTSFQLAMKNCTFPCYLELIEDPVNEERERRRKAIEKWTEESHEEFANG